MTEPSVFTPRSAHSVLRSSGCPHCPHHLLGTGVNQADYHCNISTSVPPHPPSPWLRCPNWQVTNHIILSGNLSTPKHIQRQSERQEDGIYNGLYFLLTQRDIFMSCQLRAGGTHHYVMSEGKRRGAREAKAHQCSLPSPTKI